MNKFSEISDPNHPVLVPRPQWVISDTHLGHENILTYCPWRRTWAESLAAHDQEVISAWRKSVREQEWVLHLGDFALCQKERLSELRRSLPGRIMLVRGNHDRSAATMRDAGFDLVCSAVRINDGDHHWFGRHNPASFSVREAAGARRLLHGHSHGNEIALHIHPRVRAKAIDCSLDSVKSIGPVTWESVC